MNNGQSEMDDDKIHSNRHMEITRELDPATSLAIIRVNRPGTAPNVTGEGRRDEPDEWKRLALEFEEEVQRLRPLAMENKRLRRCVGGVTVLGRALSRAKSEVAELKNWKQFGRSDVTSRDANANDEIIQGSVEVVQDTSYNGLPKHPDELPNGLPEKPSEKQECRHGLRREELPPTELVEDKKDSNSQPEDTTGQIAAGLEKSDQGRETAGAPEIQSKGVEIKTAASVSTAGKPDQTKDRALGQDGQELRGSDRAPAPGAYQGQIGDDDGDAELATVEAMLSELTADVTPLMDQTTPGVRSVATVTEESGIFVTQKLAKLEEASFQMQIQELKKVNHDWRKYNERKQLDFIAQKKILQSQLNDASVEAKKRAEHYDQMLLTAKTRIDESLERCKDLQSELDQERLRNDNVEKLNRSLAKQKQTMSGEIKRLKEALERNYQNKLSSRPPSSPTLHYGPVPSNTTNAEEPPLVRDATKTHQAVSERPKSPTATSEPLPLMSPMDEAGTGVRPKTPPERTTKRTADRARAHGEDMASEEQYAGNVEKSMNKQQLKEQVELHRQQHKMFESDFRKERLDKNRAINELQTVRQKLNNSQYGHHHQVKEAKMKDVIAPVRGPKQEVYTPSSPPNQVSPHKANRRTQSGLKAVPVGLDRTGKDVTVVQYGDHNNPIKLVANNTAVIIRAEPEGLRLLNIQLGGQVEEARREHSLEPFQCPRCQRLFRGREWVSYEHHVTLCNV